VHKDVANTSVLLIPRLHSGLELHQETLSKTQQRLEGDQMLVSGWNLPPLWRPNGYLVCLLAYWKLCGSSAVQVLWFL